MVPYKRSLTALVRRLRLEMTDSERLLWSKLRRKQLKGIQFYRHRVIGDYIVDFYSREAGLVIEVDGGQHFKTENKEKDRIRDAYLEARGLQVLRFDNFQVLKDTEAVLEVVLAAIPKG